MPNKRVIDVDFEPNELVREVLNPSFALPVTALQREALAIRHRLGPTALQELSSLLNDGVDAVTAVLAVKRQDLHQFGLKLAQIRLDAEINETRIRQEARAAHGHEAGATQTKKGEKNRSAVRGEYPDALTEVRKSHSGKRFHGDHGIAVRMIAEKLDLSVPTVRRHLKGSGPRSNKASN